MAFAAVRVAECAYVGTVADKAMFGAGDQLLQIPVARGKLKAYPSWDAMLAEWRAMLEALATAHIHGRAEVDPKQGDVSCQYCEVKAVCRIFEQDPA